MKLSVLSGLAISILFFGLQTLPAQTIDLPSSKQLIGEAPGAPQRLNSMPVSIVASPDGRYIVTVNAGYGTWQSKYEQSLAIYDTRTGTVTDFPDARTSRKSKETLYSGAAFSLDGQHIYVSMASLTNPTGDGKGNPGSGIAVYSFSTGVVVPERFIPIPMQPLADGRTTQLPAGKQSHEGVPYPAAIAVTGAPGAEKLLVALNLSDSAVLLDARTGKILHSFDFAESNAVPSTYPIAAAVSQDGKRGYVALWNASEVVELDLEHGKVLRTIALMKPSNPVAAGSHPCALALSPDGNTLYVALSNRDAVAAVDVRGNRFKLRGYFDTRLPGQSYFGAEPAAVAVSADGRRVYAANMGSDAVAVLDLAKLTPQAAKQGMVEPTGFVPTEWMPISVAVAGGKLYVATDKSKGTGPNKAPQPEVNGTPGKGTTYIATLLYGSLASIKEQEIAGNLKKWTSLVLTENRMKAAQQKIVFASGRNPIRHVIYIIKENRTYDQILGDLKQNGKPVGNGDAALTMYGATITPNEHKLALQFGVLDNFFDSGEVSGDGHVWSTAAIGTDYLERNWQINYRNTQRTYDFEGVVADGYPLLQKIPDVNQPASGYLWGNLAAHGKTYYHFGEYISSKFCDTTATANPQLGPVLEGSPCATPSIKPGAAIPADWGGGTNKWQWAIPRLASNTATKPQLVGHFAPDAPDFNLMIPDQIRVNVFMRHFDGWVADQKRGKDTMPDFVLLRLPDDHTAGTRPGSPTPKASVADNDLAVGRVADAVSHSPFWNNTAIFILEDDAQNGADHVDAHRSIALVISKYAPHGPHGGAFVDSHFYSTVSVIRTMETLLGLPPMNNDDAFCSQIASLFSGPGDQAPYTADASNRANGLIYQANSKNAVGAQASMKMDFTHADHAPVDKLNIILWKDAMGNAPVPAMLKRPVKRSSTDGDDD